MISNLNKANIALNLRHMTTKPAPQHFAYHNQKYPVLKRVQTYRAMLKQLTKKIFYIDLYLHLYNVFLNI